MRYLAAVVVVFDRVPFPWQRCFVGLFPQPADLSSNQTMLKQHLNFRLCYYLKWVAIFSMCIIIHKYIINWKIFIFRKMKATRSSFQYFFLTRGSSLHKIKCQDLPIITIFYGIKFYNVFFFVNTTTSLMSLCLTKHFPAILCGSIATIEPLANRHKTQGNLSNCKSSIFAKIRNHSQIICEYPKKIHKNSQTFVLINSPSIQPSTRQPIKPRPKTRRIEHIKKIQSFSRKRLTFRHVNSGNLSFGNCLGEKSKILDRASFFFHPLGSRRWIHIVAR